MPTEPKELISTPSGAPRMDAVPGDTQSADAVVNPTHDVAPTPRRPLKSVTIEEQANVVQIFSPWGKAVDDSSALEIKNYIEAERNLDQAEIKLQFGESTYDEAYAHHDAALQQSGMQFSDEKVKNHYLCDALKPYIRNIYYSQIAVEYAQVTADEAWEALQLSVKEIPVFPALPTQGAAVDDLPALNAANAHGLVLTSHIGAVQTGALCRLGSAIDTSDDDEMNIPSPPWFSAVPSNDGQEVESSVEAHSEEFDLAF